MSQSRPFVAGVDSSTQSCKIVIVDPTTGTIVRQGKAAHPDGTEIDPQYWWDAFLRAVEDAGARRRRRSFSRRAAAWNGLS